MGLEGERPDHGVGELVDVRGATPMCQVPFWAPGWGGGGYSPKKQTQSSLRGLGRQPGEFGHYPMDVGSPGRDYF